MPKYANLNLKFCFWSENQFENNEATLQHLINYIQMLVKVFLRCNL